MHWVNPSYFLLASEFVFFSVLPEKKGESECDCRFAEMCRGCGKCSIWSYHISIRDQKGLCLALLSKDNNLTQGPGVWIRSLQPTETLLISQWHDPWMPYLLQCSPMVTFRWRSQLFSMARFQRHVSRWHRISENGERLSPEPPRPSYSHFLTWFACVNPDWRSPRNQASWSSTFLVNQQT